MHFALSGIMGRLYYPTIIKAGGQTGRQWVQAGIKGSSLLSSIPENSAGNLDKILAKGVIQKYKNISKILKPARKMQFVFWHLSYLCDYDYFL